LIGEKVGASCVATCTAWPGVLLTCAAFGRSHVRRQSHNVRMLQEPSSLYVFRPNAFSAFTFACDEQWYTSVTASNILDSHAAGPGLHFAQRGQSKKRLNQSVPPATSDVFIHNPWPACLTLYFGLCVSVCHTHTRRLTPGLQCLG
jgi:hypothetical protein